MPVASNQFPVAASLVLGLALITAACGAAAAPRTRPADMPPLAVPPPPPRVIEPPPAPEPSPEPVSDLPAAPSSPARTPRREAPKAPAAEPKSEPKPETPPAEAAPPTPAPAPPVPQLSTPQTANSSEAAKAVQATVDRARAILATVNYRALTTERQKAYNDVKMFLDQAEGAIKQGNFTFAQGVAAKAETLARELAEK